MIGADTRYTVCLLYSMYPIAKYTLSLYLIYPIARYTTTLQYIHFLDTQCHSIKLLLDTQRPFIHLLDAQFPCLKLQYTQ